MELYRTEVDRPWGDLMPLSSSDFWQSTRERRLILGANASQAQLGKSIAESLLESCDSLVASRSSRSFEPAESSGTNQPIFNQNNDYFRKLEASQSPPSSSVSTSTSTAITVRNITTSKGQSTITSRPGFYRVARTTGTVGLTNLCVYADNGACHLFRLL